MKVLTPILDGVYYRLGLNGHDGKPSNKRVVYTVVVFTLAAGFIGLSARTIELGQPFTESLMFFGLGVLAGAGGHYVLSERQQLKFPLPSPGTPTAAPPPASETEPAS